MYNKTATKRGSKVDFLLSQVIVAFYVFFLFDLTVGNRNLSM